MELLVIFLTVVWWTFAVVALMTIANNSDMSGVKNSAFAIALAVFWPITALMVIPALIYQALVSSTARIRVDLRNRVVLREFEEWLKTRETQDP